MVRKVCSDTNHALSCRGAGSSLSDQNSEHAYEEERMHCQREAPSNSVLNQSSSGSDTGRYEQSFLGASMRQC
jgi:hypothetical protein